MYPLPPQVGLRADPSPAPFEARRTLRRGKPDVLTFDPPADTGVLVVPRPAPAPTGRSGWGWLSALWRVRSQRV